MTDDYTPTTREIRDAYADWCRRSTINLTARYFDAWLAAHDAEVAIQARADERERIALAIETLRPDFPIPSPISYRVARDDAARTARTPDQIGDTP